MSRTYRNLRYKSGFNKGLLDDLISRHSDNDLYNYELTKYQSIINRKDFKRVLIKKYHSSDCIHFYEFRKPRWVIKKQECKLRRITRDILKKIDSLEDIPIIPNKVLVPYYH